MLAEFTQGKPISLDRKARSMAERAYMLFGAAILLGSCGAALWSAPGPNAVWALSLGFGCLACLAAALIASRRQPEAERGA